MIETSSGFRERNQILFRAPVLPGVQSDWKKDPEPLLGPHDLLDLNGNGQADRVKFAAGPDGHVPAKTAYQEPVLVAPSWSTLKEIARAKNTEVLTVRDLPAGVFIGDVVATKTGQFGEVVENKTECIRPVDVLAAQHASAEHSETYWAVDVAAQEMLIWTPKPTCG